MKQQDIIKLFKDNNFRATPQRVAVYEYLSKNPTHPDADEIYKSVLKNNPSFSKTTVYNSLTSLEEQGFIIKVNIDSNRVRYDSDITLHGHFVCDNCKKIYDFKIESIKCSGIENFSVKQRDVYYSGLCPECNK